MNQQDRTLLLKKLLYRSCYRGCKETDLIIGNFAKEHLATMSDRQLQDFAYILDLNDADFYDWYMGKKPVPQELQSPTMLKIIATNKLNK